MTIQDQIIPSPVGVPGSAGSVIASKVTQVIGTGGNFVLPPGSFLFLPVTSITVEIQETAGVWTAIETTTFKGYIESDGTNIRIKNNVGSQASALYYQYE